MGILAMRVLCLICCVMSLACHSSATKVHDLNVDGDLVSMLQEEPAAENATLGNATTCKCINGVPGTDCFTSNFNKCASCDANHYGGQPGHCMECSTCSNGDYKRGGCGGLTGGNTDCADCEVCPTGKHKVGGCDGEAPVQCEDNVCDKCVGGQGATGMLCPAHNGEECSSCDDGYFLNGDQCTPCSTCPGGQFEEAACSATTDTQCKACAACGDGKFKAGGCTGTVDTECSACATCSEGKFAEGGCADETDTICEDCDACATGEHETRSCAATTNRECTACASCTPNVQFMSEGCSGSTNTTCSACQKCDDGKFKASGCDGLVDSKCEDCAACAVGSFKAGGCSGIADSLCQTCSGCPETEFRSGGCDANTDSQCSACTACPSGEHQTGGCNGAAGGEETQDTVCAANVCTCTNGVAATGGDCTSDGANICASCNAGHLGVTCQAFGKIFDGCANGGGEVDLTVTADTVQLDMIPGGATSKEVVVQCCKGTTADECTADECDLKCAAWTDDEQCMAAGGLTGFGSASGKCTGLTQDGGGWDLCTKAQLETKVCCGVSDKMEQACDYDNHFTWIKDIATEITP